MNKDTRQKLIHLHRCRGITRNKLRKLLQLDPSLTQLYLLSPSQLSDYLTLNKNKANILYQDLQSHTILENIRNDMANYKILTIIDEEYPPMLKTIKDAPLVLYASGETSLLNDVPSISVIGTRNPSNTAFQKTKFVVNPLIKENWVVVSGMAKGIDSIAHKLALYESGKTIAVLGGGFHHIYPIENRSLFHQIVQNGLVISEYPPNIPPKKYHFPERNRIISGMSFATLVIEATEKSGTMITVDQALDQGREVYAVPGSPLIQQTTGCLKLIQEGAKLVVSHEDIKKDWVTQGKYWYKPSSIK